ncbi:MAG: tripartite tricarboxylate transporter TctB family protein [Bacillota bacterium]
MINKLLKVDSVIAILLMAFSVYVIHYSMNIEGLSGAIDMVSPGLVPGLVGVFLFVCAAVLLFQTVKENEIKRETTNIITFLSDGIGSYAFKRLVGIIASIVAFRYLLVLFGFYVTAFFFLVVLFLLFRAVKVWQAVVISLITVGIIGYLFDILLRVPFPHGKFIPYF